LFTIGNHLVEKVRVFPDSPFLSGIRALRGFFHDPLLSDKLAGFAGVRLPFLFCPYFSGALKA
jgi:hypothetical protein